MKIQGIQSGIPGQVGFRFRFSQAFVQELLRQAMEEVFHDNIHENEPRWFNPPQGVGRMEWQLCTLYIVLCEVYGHGGLAL
ncbi:hypothetical protein V6N11_059593 [Hibiscus sabdariffa]|uniref:Uncharacterized protein n=2 Tax=Hibiscus sabdariffa TaxID=183260 RepID=A0ABR2AWG9_9ROSI